MRKIGADPTAPDSDICLVDFGVSEVVDKKLEAEAKAAVEKELKAEVDAFAKLEKELKEAEEAE